MVYKIDRSPESGRDLEMIFDHLVASYLTFDESLSDAVDHAVQRIRSIEADMDALATLPHQGTADPALGPECRHVTKQRAVIYFDVDDTRRMITILAVFFGGQDHHRHMMRRLMGEH
jgi:toxin ParE1/3/4